MPILASTTDPRIASLIPQRFLILPLAPPHSLEGGRSSL